MVLRAVLVIAVACLAGCGAGQHETGPAPGQAPAPELPRPDARLPRDAAGLARALTDTTRRLRGEIEKWRGVGDPAAGRPPEAVTLLALYQQRIYRRIASARRLGDDVLAALPRPVAGEARDTVRARRELIAIPASGHGRPRIRTAEPEPADRLRSYYGAAQRRFRVGWHVLAAVNFVESAFGKLRNDSVAGAQGPMQFLPATWRAYGLGGDVHDPRDAILGAANYLHANGAPRSYARALYRYNPSGLYVDAVLRYARRIAASRRAFYGFYAWQVFVRTPSGTRRLTGPRR